MLQRRLFVSNSTSEEKNMVVGITNSLKVDTKYMYYDGISLKPSKDVSEVSAERIEIKVVLGNSFTLEDYFILKEVNALGITNVATLQKRLSIEKKRNPMKAYPTYDYQTLNSRMRYLVQNGLLYSFTYESTEHLNIFLFCCSMPGWRLYNNKLQLNDVYVKETVFKADTEIFKRLASNSVAYAFAASPLCESVFLKDKINVDRSCQNIFAKLTLKVNDGIIKYIVEPIYFGIDHRIISDEENEKNIKDRLTIFENYIGSLEQGKKVKLIITVENFSGLGKVLDIIKQREIEFYVNNCYFTSENVIHDSDGSLSQSFLKLQIKENGYSFKPVRDIYS